MSDLTYKNFIFEVNSEVFFLRNTLFLEKYETVIKTF
jgi:hypothetical protein